MQVSTDPFAAASNDNVNASNCPKTRFDLLDRGGERLMSAGQTRNAAKRILTDSVVNGSIH